MMQHQRPTFATDTGNATPVYLVTQESLEDLLEGLSENASAWVESTGFSAATGTVVLVPGPEGTISLALGGLGSEASLKRRRFTAASIASKLPAGTWKLEGDLSQNLREECALAWLLSSYRFTRYKSGMPLTASLICPEGVDQQRIETIAAGEFLTRDLINTPTEDMGPDELEEECRALCAEHGASIHVTIGDSLLEQNFPLIHTVGRASHRAPRLIDFSWGKTGPAITLVGKGVCFDTGGLNLKPGGSMGLMKKDMGGAATVLGLAHMIMGLELNVRLRVLIPAVENAVSGSSFRPGDILTARNGNTVEINNTDAEGRLVLADALALANEGEQDLLVSMATLTGAARVAVGPDLSPFYCDDENVATALSLAGKASHDPVWRMPFWDPYETMIEPGIADLDNAPAGGFAGSITAALFLRRFAGTNRYVHFDIYGWCPKPEPGRPKGGVGMGARALLTALPDFLDL